MNPDWFIPHVIDKIGDRRQITYGLTDFTGTVSPEMRAFVSTRLAWLDQLTDLAALEAELVALLAADAAQTARVEALLAGAVAPFVATRQQMDSLWAGVEELAAASDAIERQQRDLEQQLAALEQGD